MIFELMSGHNLALDYETEWTELNVQDALSGNLLKAGSLQADYNGAVSGTQLNGTLDIILSNSLSGGVNAKRIMINQSENSNDADILVFYANFKYIKLIYTQNNIESGQLTVSLNFE